MAVKKSKKYEVGDVIAVYIEHKYYEKPFFSIAVVSSTESKIFTDESFLFLLDDIYDLAGKNHIEYEYPFYNGKEYKIVKYYGNLRDIVNIEYNGYSFTDENNTKVLNYIKNVNPEYFI